MNALTPEGQEDTPIRCAFDGCNAELYRELANDAYCLLHFPGEDKTADFNTLVQTKLTQADFDFAGGWFPETADFHNTQFKSDASFRNAKFMKGANFAGSRFDGTADFSDSRFKAEDPSSATNVDFTGVTFSKDCNLSNSSFEGSTTFVSSRFEAKASFSFANFAGPTVIAGSFVGDACFREATFREAATVCAWFGAEAQFDRVRFLKIGDFSQARFNGFAELTMMEFMDDARFHRCVFTSHVDFSYSFFEKKVDFSFAQFQKSVRFQGGFLKWNRTVRTFSIKSFLDLQEAVFDHPDAVTFHSVSLRPSWLIGTNPREFNFVNVLWYPAKLSEEIEHFTQRRVPYYHRLLEKLFWEISKNQEENSYFEQASLFRFWAFDVRRRSRLYGWKFWTLDWWYWAVSGYGERAGRAFLWLVVLWVVFGALYRLSGLGHLRLTQTMGYSLQVLFLQNPEPLPSTLSQRVFFSLEKVSGAVQAALLALAVRRKYMR